MKPKYILKSSRIDLCYNTVPETKPITKFSLKPSSAAAPDSLNADKVLTRIAVDERTT